MGILGVLAIIQGIVLIIFSLGPKNRQTNVNPVINFIIGVVFIGVGSLMMS